MSTTMKIVSALLLIIGEILCVYAEMIAARAHSEGHPFLSVFTKGFLFITVAGAMLIAGYMFGYRAFNRNIWVVSVLSVTSILVVEPGLAYMIFRETPTRGALVGLIFGAMGFVATLL